VAVGRHLRGRLTVKASQADDHAAAWEADGKRLRVLRQMYQEQTARDDLEIDAMLADYVAAQDASWVVSLNP